MSEGRILAIHHQIFLGEIVAGHLKKDMLDLLEVMNTSGVKFATDDTQVMADTFGVYSMEKVKNKLKVVKNDNASKN